LFQSWVVIHCLDAFSVHFPVVSTLGGQIVLAN
jgi:hypothetical protein